ncbi:hypothetical protein AB1L30_06160 [Bremerella sp. JC817]|uniref:hypothetical protein n=1 Tax=Bremerella sp. JC817 TaxID=3231756 RepID=UPI003457C655
MSAYPIFGTITLPVAWTRKQWEQFVANSPILRQVESIEVTCPFTQRPTELNHPTHVFAGIFNDAQIAASIRCVEEVVEVYAPSEFDAARLKPLEELVEAPFERY